MGMVSDWFRGLLFCGSDNAVLGEDAQLMTCRSKLDRTTRLSGID